MKKYNKLNKFLVLLAGGVMLYAAPVQGQDVKDTLLKQDPEHQSLPTDKLSLQKCVEIGLANNLDVRQSELQMQTARINWNQARLNQLPDVAGTASSGINQGRSIDPFTNTYSNQQINYSSYGLSSGVVLFSGGLLMNTARQNNLSYQASGMDWQQTKDNLTLNIILAYLQVLSNTDLLKQSTQQADLSLKQVERLEILNREGAIAPYLLYDLRGQYASDKLSIIAAANSLETSKVQLCALMNVPYRKELDVERLDQEVFAEQYEGSPDEIYNETLASFAQVKAVTLRTRSALLGVKAARSTLYPTLSLNGNVNTNYSSAARNDIFINNTEVTSNDYVVVNGAQTSVIRQQSNFDSRKISYNNQLNNNLFNSISLNLRVPIFTNWQARNRIRLAKIQYRNYGLIEGTTKTQLQQAVEQAHVNLVTAQDRYKTLMEQSAAFQESFRSAEIRFTEGVVNSVDYLVAKINLDRTNINSIIAKYDYVLRTRILDYYRGRKLW